MELKELIERLELALGCLIGSNASGITPINQFKSIINDLKKVKKLTTPDTSSSVFLVQHKETLINYGLFSDRKKAENYINNNTGLFGIQEIEIA